MANIDNSKAIKNIDRENIYGNIQDFPYQIERCWRLWQKTSLPIHFINAKSILFLGMGGSGIGAALVASLAKTKAKTPLIVERDYEIPGSVNKDTLVIAVSYSGNTEETIE